MAIFLTKKTAVEELNMQVHRHDRTWLYIMINVISYSYTYNYYMDKLYTMYIRRIRNGREARLALRLPEHLFRVK